MIRLFLFLLLTASCQATPRIDFEQIEFYETFTLTDASDSLLVDIQQKIYDRFVQSLMSQDDQQLLTIEKQLADLYATNAQNLIRYWESYARYYHAIYALKKGDRELAEQYLSQAIAWLDQLKKKNAEDHALLSMLQGFAIQFNPQKTMQLAMASKQNAELALAIDAQNLRAHYVVASNDFYTPEQYGGGKKVEAHLQKAVALPTQKIKNDLLPSWGKEEAYEMLIKWYIKKEQWETAKTYFQEAIAAFPDNYQLSQLATQLVSK